LRHLEPDVLTGLRFTCALPLLAVVALTQGALAPPASSAADWLRLLLLALVSGLLGMLLYYRGLRTTPASIATFAELAFPASALVINYVVLGATVDAVQLAGFAILWATIALLHWVPVRIAAPAAVVLRPSPAPHL
jgi:DME family drug/metabolite transporter